MKGSLFFGWKSVYEMADFCYNIRILLRSVFVGKIVKKLVTIVLALGVFASTLYVEARMPVETAMSGEKKVTVSQKELEPGAKIETGPEERLTIHFEDRGEIRLAPSSSVSFVNETEEGFQFELHEGRMWVNTIFTFSPLQVRTGNALFIPHKAAFDVQANASSSTVKVLASTVLVGLVPTNGQTNNQEIINSFLVPQGSQAMVSNAKVAQNAQILKQLLYSKLIKEFQFSLIDKNVKDPWITENLEADQKLLKSVSQERFDAVNGRSLKFSSLSSFGYQLDQTFARVSDTLTVSDEKKTARHIEAIFDHLYDSEYLLMFGRSSEAKERIELFKKNLDEQFSAGDSGLQDLLLGKLRRAYTDLRFVLPDSPLYEVKVQVSDLLASHLGHDTEGITEKLGLIRDYMNYAYALADANVVQARVALQQYYDRFAVLMEAERSRLQGVKSLVSQENQIMDNLLRQYPQFYQDAYFAMKLFVESEWLKLLPEGTDKKEERQTIISTKIDFLKQLQQFFLAEKVGLSDARLVTVRLINEIKDLQTGSEVGVNQLFAQRLKDYGNFLIFLNTTNVSQLRGSSPQEQYEDFQFLQREEISVEKALNVVLGEETLAPALTTADILKQIAQDFEAVGVTNLGLAALSDLKQTVLGVSGELDGVTFTAQYDWDKQLLSDLQVNGQTVSEDAVRLNVLESVLGGQASPATQETGQTPIQGTEAELSRAETIALSLLIQKLKAANITVDAKNVVISDLNTGSFVVNGAMLADNVRIQIAFAYQTTGDAVSSLVVRTVAGDRTVEGTLKLAEVSAKAKAVYAEGE